MDDSPPVPSSPIRELIKDKEHLVRVAALFLAALVVFLIARAILVPKDFGAYGHYRPGALDDARARPVVHAGRGVCRDCHTDEAKSLGEGKHKGVGCEACHGALARHADGSSAAKPQRPPGRETCVICHTANVAKPKGFPQVDPAEHAAEGLCIECHSPHNPGSAPETKK